MGGTGEGVSVTRGLEPVVLFARIAGDGEQAFHCGV